MTSALRIIRQPDQSRLFETPIHTKLIRTGTIGDGSCFFHAFGYSMFHNYRQADLETRMKIVMTMREQIASSVTIERLRSLGGGETYRMLLGGALRNTLLEMKEPFEHPFEHWDHTILADVSTRWRTVSCSDCCDVIMDHVTDRIRVEELVAQSETLSLEMFRRHLMESWVDDFFMEIVSDFFECNFFFLNAGSRLPYKIFTKNKYEMNVVFAWVEETHYECIGELVGGEKIKRVFSNDDSLILALNSTQYLVL